MVTKEGKITGSLIGMFIRAHKAGTVDCGFFNEEDKPIPVTGTSTCYSVRSEGEDGDVAIRVSVVEEGAPFIAEIDTEGRVMVTEGSVDGFIDACKRYLG